jgi:hypothetical protein
MKLTHTLAMLALVLAGFATEAQSLKKDISLRVSRDKSNIRSIDFFAGNNIIISVSQDGKVRLDARPGTQYAYLDEFSRRRDSKLRSLDFKPVDYYDNFDQSRAGKLKAIGDIAITYYDKFDGFDNVGRVKTIGNVKIAYNDRFDGFDNQGKIKSIGDISVKFYDRFDSDLNGKLKSVGNTVITYYDHWDGEDRKGLIKAVTGHTPYVTVRGLIEDRFTDDNSVFN